MRIDVQSNTSPIRAGDEVMIDFHPTWTDIGTLYYSVHLLARIGNRIVARTLASSVSIFDARFPWTVDAVGLQLQVRVTAHLAFGLKRNALSPIFTVVPAPPRVVAPEPDERLAVGSYTVTWTQDAPDPDSYGILLAPDGGPNLQPLALDIPGSARSAAVMIPGPATDDAVLHVRAQFVEFLPAQGDETVPIRVIASPVVKVTRPDTRLIFAIGDLEAIEWTASGPVTGFDVQLSRDGGHTWHTLFSDLPASRREVDWAVDPPASESCRIRVRADWAEGQVSDVSDRVFLIRVR